MSVYRTPLLLLIPVLCCVPSLEAQDVLTWKFSPGEVLRYGVSQTMKTSRMVGDQELASTMVQAMDMEWAVQDYAEDGTTVKIHQTVNRIQMKMDGGPTKAMEFDTANPTPSDNPFISKMSEVFGNIINQPFEVYMAPTGEVRSVVVPPALLNAINQNAAGNASALSKETLQDMMKQSAVTLPPEPVQQGSKWSSNQQVKLPFGTMTVQSMMTYAGRDASGNVDIAVVPVISVTPADGAGPRLSLRSSSGKGRILFNNTTGRVLQSQLDLSLEMTMQVGEQSFDQTVQQTTSMKLQQ